MMKGRAVNHQLKYCTLTVIGTSRAGPANCYVQKAQLEEGPGKMNTTVLLATLAAVVLAQGAPPKTTNMTEVFIIPHTHADTGWMITAEEYYRQLVRPILDSQVRALASNASWRYCWAEIMYFARWWRDQSPAVRAQARELAVAGQLEFVEGGWTQADELVVSLDERVQNLEHGHQWLLDNIASDAAFVRR